MINRVKMCYNKKSFRTLKEAQKNADKWNLRVYECPICYCFHTSSQEAPPEFVTKEEMQNRLLEQEKKIHTAYKSMIKKYQEKCRDNKKLTFENIKLKATLRDIEHINGSKRDESKTNTI